jgi:hypothetical protein
MSARKTLYIAAGALLLWAVGLLLTPSAPQPAAASGVPAERSRPLNRPPKPAIDPRHAKDFRSFVQHSTQSGFPKLTRQEIDDYLQARSRSASALLTAFRLSEDEAFLREAMEKFPHDTQVLLASLRLVGDPSNPSNDPTRKTALSTPSPPAPSLISGKMTKPSPRWRNPPGSPSATTRSSPARTTRRPISLPDFRHSKRR